MSETDKQGCLVIKAGQLAMLTEGEWSDYSPIFAVRALCDINIAEQMAAFHDAHRGRWTFNQQFALWLIKQGLVDEVECAEIHLGSHGRPSASIKKDWTSDACEWAVT